MSALREARFLAARGDEEAALAAVDTVLAAQPRHVEATLLKASLLLERREHDAALELARRATSLAPDSPEALEGLARCLHVLRRDDEALDAARRARDALPPGVEPARVGPVYLTLLWCLREKRLYREAIAAAEEGLARCHDVVLAEWAETVQEEYAESQRERC